MKTFLRIAGGILAFLIVAIIGLNIYFTDARLQQTVMPYVNDAVGRDVQVESMSLTFFSTFPQPGLSISNMSIPGETEDDTLMALDELAVGVKFFSLFGDEISISEIKLNNPRFTYRVYPDSTTNIDFLLATEAEEDTTAEGYAINIPYFEVINGQFGYIDETSATDIRLSDLNSTISLRYADLIESTVDMELGGLYATIDSSSYVSGLPLSLSQESTIDMDQETVTLSSGTFSIRGLALNLTGSISDWSTSPAVDLNFSSSSDNFGELLRLVPTEYEEHVRDLETRGSLSVDGTLSGTIASDQIPNFDASIQIQDGYLKNPDLPQAIENIQLTAKASNKLVTVENLNAKAGSNTISGSGSLEDPLNENGTFSFNLNGDVDLATISSFYDISQFDIEQMSGQVNLSAKATGNRAKPEAANFNADLKLTNGALKYSGVPKAIEDININAKANQDLVTINSMNIAAAPNTFSLKGTIQKPLDEANRAINLDTNLKFDLASLKNFYPISEDTLEMNGILTAQATLEGKAAQIERSVQSGSITLKNGFLFYEAMGKQPLRDITFESVLEGPKLTIVNAGFRSGENNLKVGGVINNYLSENRSVDLKLEGFAMLNRITNYYDLQPTVTKLNGSASVNFRAQGRLDNPAEMAFNGSLDISGMNMDGEGLVQPINDLNGTMKLTPSSANLDSLAFNFGASDILLSGSLKDYMEYLKEESNRATTPHLTGNYYSSFVNVDEIIDWEDTTATDTILIELPDLNSTITAKVDRMLVTGVNLRNLSAKAATTPTQIKMNEASAELFEGKATGSFTWDVPQPDRTKITFNGSLQGVRGETFFKEYQVLGNKSKFHEYISGAFNSDIEYSSELNQFLEPVITSTEMDGNFGMSRSRLKNHPIQLRIANLLKAQELESVSLDEWKSTFTVSDTVLTLKNLRLTSSDVGMELNGTQHLISEKINYQIKLLLPPRFKKAIASVITTQAADALTQENGTIMVPLRVTGTINNPTIKPDQEVIKPIIQKYLKDKAGNALKKLFGNDG